MITGKKKIDLTTETILAKISPYDIFKYYMPNKNWEVNSVTNSPFREDRHPSMIIGNRSGRLTFMDFADTSKKGDCFSFVMLMYSLSSIDEALRMIDRDFGLGIVHTENVGEYKRIVEQYKQPEEEGKRYSLIQAVTRPFTKEELEYWNLYHQDIQDLRDNNIYSIKKLFLNKQLFSLKETELRFGYYYNGCWKIYKPFAPKKNKWVPNNVPITTMDGKDDIKNCKTAFISKSKKDFMVIKKVYPCCCAVQNEGVACFSHENIEYLKANSDRQILGFDSDEPGVANSQQITKIFDFDYCNVPKKYLSEGINDFADLGKHYGLKAVEQIFKDKGIL